MRVPLSVQLGKANKEIERLRLLLDEQEKQRRKEVDALILLYRGVETPCESCAGLGVKLYGNTSTWHYGFGGQALTPDVCDSCWGSGDTNRKWTNVRKLYAESSAVEEIIGGIIRTLRDG